MSRREAEPERHAGGHRHERLSQLLFEELDSLLRDEIRDLKRQLDQAIANQQVSAEESKANIVKPDEEHFIWPFQGEYWRDELGFYRQTITSKCGR